MSEPSLAIVIPIGPGDRAWETLLPMLRDAGARQIVLAATYGDPIAHAPAGVMLVRSGAGRAAQQNAGAAATSTSWIWFLHADSCVDDVAIAQLWRFIRSGVRGIGYFDLRFHDGPRWMRLNQWGARLRSRWLGKPFGDQGFIMPSMLFFDHGGFDATIRYGEDHALVWMARRRGVPILAVGASIGTSARKYVERGWWTTTRHHLLETLRQSLLFSRRERQR